MLFVGEQLKIGLEQVGAMTVTEFRLWCAYFELRKDMST